MFVLLAILPEGNRRSQLLRVIIPRMAMPGIAARNVAEMKKKQVVLLR